MLFFFFFNDTATTEIYTLSDTLSLHDALPIWVVVGRDEPRREYRGGPRVVHAQAVGATRPRRRRCSTRSHQRAIRLEVASRITGSAVGTAERSCGVSHAGSMGGRRVECGASAVECHSTSSASGLGSHLGLRDRDAGPERADRGVVALPSAAIRAQ